MLPMLLPLLPLPLLRQARGFSFITSRRGYTLSCRW